MFHCGGGVCTRCSEFFKCILNETVCNVDAYWQRVSVLPNMHVLLHFPSPASCLKSQRSTKRTHHLLLFVNSLCVNQIEIISVLVVSKYFLWMVRHLLWVLDMSVISHPICWAIASVAFALKLTSLFIGRTVYRGAAKCDWPSSHVYGLPCHFSPLYLSLVQISNVNVKFLVITIE